MHSCQLYQIFGLVSDFPLMNFMFLFWAFLVMISWLRRCICKSTLVHLSPPKTTISCFEKEIKCIVMRFPDTPWNFDLKNVQYYQKANYLRCFGICLQDFRQSELKRAWLRSLLKWQLICMLETIYRESWRVTEPRCWCCLSHLSAAILLIIWITNPP